MIEFDYDLETEGVIIKVRGEPTLHLHGDDIANFLACIGRDRLTKIKETNKHVADAFAFWINQKRCETCDGTGMVQK